MQTHQCATSRPQTLQPTSTTQTSVNSASLDKDDVTKSIQLPKELELVPTVIEFPSDRHRWNTNEEIAAILLAFSEHQRWQSEEVKVWPSSGTMVLYSRKKVRYRRDGFCWKKRRDGKTTREDHMKLKVQGVECIYGCYVHSAILQTFHRRCYWLLQNPEIVLVHYLNVPLAEDSKLSVPTLSLCPEKEWTQEELIGQLQPMFASMQQSDPSNVTEQLIEETIRSIVNKLMISQKKSTGRTHHDCTCANAPNCTHMGRRIISPKLALDGSPGSKASQWVQKHLVSMLHGGQTATGVQTGHDHTSGVLLNAARQLDSQSRTISHTPVFVNLSQLSGTNNVIILNSQPTATVPLMKTPMADTSRMPPPPPPPASIGNPVLQGTITHQMSDPNLAARLAQDVKAKPSSCSDTQCGESGVKHEPSDKATFNSALSGRLNDWLGCEKECGEVTAHCLDALMDEPCTEEHAAKSESNVPTCSVSLKEDSIMSPDISATIPHGNIDLSDYANITSPSSSHFSLDGFDINFPGFDEHLKWGLESNPGRETGSHGQLGVASDDGVTSPGHQAMTLTDGMTSLGHVGRCVEGDVSNKNSHESRLTITDFSPEWSYPEGGTKVLVTGPWSNSSSTYTVLLDSVPIPATLVQSGVLRCFSPAHVAGLVTLEVACDSHVISNLVVFEYRVREMSHRMSSHKPSDWFSVSEAELKVAVMEKLEELKKRLSTDLTNFAPAQAGNLIGGHDAFETHVVEYCMQLSKRSWCHGDELLKGCAGSRHLTLLHLVAALGCTKLITTLVKWREVNGSRVLEHDVNPLGLDNNASTPLMWACALGHTEAATVLYRVNQGALYVCNRDGTTSMHLAQQRGHFALVQHLASLQMTTQVHMHAAPPAGSQVPVATNGTLVNAPPSGGILHFMNAPVASSTPRLVHEHLSVVHTEPHAAVRQTGTTLFPHQWHIPDNKQLTIEIPAPLTLINQSGHRGASVPRSLHASQGAAPPGTPSQRRFMKRTSLDVLPNYMQLHTDRDGNALAPSATPAGMRSVNSDPYLARLEAAHDPDPMISVSGRDVNSPDMFMQTDYHASYHDSFSLDDDLQHESAMDTEDVTSSTNLPKEMVTLANEIIAGMPERNKLCLPPHAPPGGDISGLLEAAEMTVNSCRDRSSSYSSFSSSCSSCHTPPGVSAGVVSADDSGISTPLEGLVCDEYRYHELGTPESSVSPGSSCLPSPYSFRLDSPPPTAADFTEYFNAPTTYMQKDFSQLTLSDDEQRNLYAAAQLIQCYYRKYLDKKEYLQEQQQQQQQQQRQKQRELEAAVLIQSYYRRYKQYMYYKKMTQAAVLIQSQFRSYTAQKRFKLSRDAATVIQSRYRAYREHKGYKRRRTAAVIIQQRFRSHYQRNRVKQQESAGKLRKRLQQTEMGVEISGVTEPAVAPPTSDDRNCGSSDITTDQSEGSSCDAT